MVLKRSWTDLRGHLGASWEHLGSILGVSWRVLKDLGEILGLMGSSWEHLSTSWEQFGASWPYLRPSWPHHPAKMVQLSTTGEEHGPSILKNVFSERLFFDTPLE